MKVSLSFNRHFPNPEKVTEAAPFLNPLGPDIILGGQWAEQSLADPIAPKNDTLFGPRGAVLTKPGGPLVISDTGHHRLMIWNHLPIKDNTPCDFIIGQHDCESEGRNGKQDPHAASLNVPTGIASDGTALAVADSWNNRVLIWHQMPERQNQPADVVVGQTNFTDTLANQGSSVGRGTLNWCYGVSIWQGNLVVADTGNRRVLIWEGLPQKNGSAAELVLGQKDFVSRDENAGLDAGAYGMRWPHGIAFVESKILVSDAGNNRIMVWKKRPETPGEPCDFVLGQQNLISLEHNQAAYLPTAHTLNMPYDVTQWGNQIIVADTANSRLLAWPNHQIAQNAPASGLAGQPDFASKGDNRWQSPQRDSLCWPYGLSAMEQTLIVTDTGNNRVMIWGGVE